MGHSTSDTDSSATGSLTMLKIMQSPWGFLFFKAFKLPNKDSSQSISKNGDKLI